MAEVKVLVPSIITLGYFQEVSDDDYGSCMWARFYFDTENYSLSIQSDCGEYSYSWRPTPESESFLQLMRRINSDYLLDKISSRSVINPSETCESICEYLRDQGFENFIDDEFIQDISDACDSRYECQLIEDVTKVIEEKSIFITTYDVADCISLDYPRAAKKICEVFKSHIQPVVKKLESPNSRVLILPCSVGDFLYEVLDFGDWVDTCSKGCYSCTTDCPNYKQRYVPNYQVSKVKMQSNQLIVSYMGRLGKNVFTTEEEAQAEVERRMRELNDNTDVEN